MLGQLTLCTHVQLISMYSTSSCICSFSTTCCMFIMKIGSVFLGFCIIIFLHVPIQPFFYLQTIFPEPQPRKSDVFHLAANLMDRYLGYYPPSTEGEFRTVASACTMISVKLRRSREETLGFSYESLRPHFYDISEKEVRVSYYNNCLFETNFFAKQLGS